MKVLSISDAVRNVRTEDANWIQVTYYDKDDNICHVSMGLKKAISRLKMGCSK